MEVTGALVEIRGSVALHRRSPSSGAGAVGAGREDKPELRSPVVGAAATRPPEDWEVLSIPRVVALPSPEYRGPAFLVRAVSSLKSMDYLPCMVVAPALDRAVPVESGSRAG